MISCFRRKRFPVLKLSPLCLALLIPMANASDNNKDAFLPQESMLDHCFSVHGQQEFLHWSEVERPHIPAQEDEDKSVKRTIYHFGSECPLALWDGATPDDSCKAFTQKLQGCKSFICSEFAQNYLAKHAFDSSNHPNTRGDKMAAFKAAGACRVQETTETWGDREQIRKMHQGQEKSRAARGPHPPHNPPSGQLREAVRTQRDPPRNPPIGQLPEAVRNQKGKGFLGRSPSPRRRRSDRSRSPHRDRTRSPIGLTSVAKYGQHISQRQPIGQMQATPRTDLQNVGDSITDQAHKMLAAATDCLKAVSTAQGSRSSSSVAPGPVVLAAPSDGSVRVQLEELEVLQTCLERSSQSQKRVIDALTFFTRQFEDERKIIDEAKSAVSTLIIKSKAHMR